MKYLDLHEKFIDAINEKIPRKTDLVNFVADTLFIEKDSAYRRLSGKVSFSAREIGIITDKLGISLDKLMHRSNEEQIWLPFILEHPLKVRSLETLLDVTEQCIVQMNDIVKEPAEVGNIHSTMPIEFYLHSPVLTKFFFFRWGHFFVGSKEYDNYSEWELPQKVVELGEQLIAAYKFEKIFYIWDDAIIWLHCREIVNMHKMGVITTDEKNELKQAFKDLLSKLEQAFSGVSIPEMPFDINKTSFYVSSIHLGFTCNYFVSGKCKHFITMQTIFSFCLIDNNIETFHRLKDWTDSFKGISTLLSQSGRIERKIFFDNQRNIIDYVLG